MLKQISETCPFQRSKEIRIFVSVFYNCLNLMVTMVFKIFFDIFYSLD